MNGLLTEALVVRVVDYGEADRVVTLLTRSQGKVTALARGARKSRRRYSALTLFALGEASLKAGRGELYSMDGFDMRRGYPHLGLDVARLAHAAYACELARELSPPGHAEPALYDLLKSMLQCLDEGAETPAAAPLLGAARLRIFELGVLSVLGLAPELARCLGCEAQLTELAEDGGEQLDLRSGGVRCGSCAGAGPGRRTLPVRVRALLASGQGTPLVDAEKLVTGYGLGQAGRTTFEGARDAMLAILHEHLPHPLHSLEFIAKLNARPGGDR